MINNEEWVCHTCLGSLRDGEVPKLYVTNGMKWPNRPPELDLHQLEERLIALRIPLKRVATKRSVLVERQCYQCVS